MRFILAINKVIPEINYTGLWNSESRGAVEREGGREKERERETEKRKEEKHRDASKREKRRRRGWRGVKKRGRKINGLVTV